MPEGKARVLALTGAGVLSQVGMTFLIVGLSFGKSPPPAPPPAVQAAAIAYSGAVGSSAAGSPAAADANSTPSYVTALGRSRPVHLSIPRVGIETSLMDLGLQPDGTIEVPPDSSTAPAGWYRYLASPGEAGTAVIVGHLDSPQAPAVFFNLGAMRPGDHLSVTRADGTRASFTVTEVGSYPHDQFPTEAVYGSSPTPVLRLVTCGGPFQRGVGYDGNVVVFADMDSSPGLPTDAPAAAPALDVPATLPADAPVAETPTPAPSPRRHAVTSDTNTERAPSTTSSEERAPSTTSSEERAPSTTSSEERASDERASDERSSGGTPTDVSSTDSAATKTSASQPAGRRSEIVEPEPSRVETQSRAPRRAHATPQPVYVPPEAD